MALRQLLITKRIAELNAKLAGLRDKDAEFETRIAALKTREAELETAVNEVTDETPEEDRKVVDDAVTQFETDQAALETEKGDTEAEKTRLSDEIKKLTDELEEINKKAATPPAPPKGEERKVESKMETRTKFFRHERTGARRVFLPR